MTRLLSCFLAFSLILLVPVEAEAKRFGGGFSLGKSPSSAPARKAPDQTQQPTANPANPAGAAGAAGTAAKTGLAPGLIGGLLAGGIFGALLFGGAFEGVQLMDILLIGLVLFVLYRLFAGRSPQAAYAGGQPQSGTAGFESRPSIESRPNAFQSHVEPAGQSDRFDGPAQFRPVETPDWFDAEAFLAAAPQHFEALQSAWDAQNWSEIATYTSPELLAQLKTNRSVLPENQRTETISLDVELCGFEEQKSAAMVSLRYSGWIRESASSDPERFAEIWHLSRDSGPQSEGWQLVGIEQE